MYQIAQRRSHHAHQTSETSHAFELHVGSRRFQGYYNIREMLTSFVSEQFQKIEISQYQFDWRHWKLLYLVVQHKCQFHHWRFSVGCSFGLTLVAICFRVLVRWQHSSFRSTKKIFFLSSSSRCLQKHFETRWLDRYITIIALLPILGFAFVIRVYFLGKHHSRIWMIGLRR